MRESEKYFLGCDLCTHPVAVAAIITSAAATTKDSTLETVRYLDLLWKSRLVEQKLDDIVVVAAEATVIITTTTK